MENWVQICLECIYLNLLLPLKIHKFKTMQLCCFWRIQKLLAWVTSWYIHISCLFWISNFVMHLWIIFAVHCLHICSLAWAILHSTYGLKLLHFVSLLVQKNRPTGILDRAEIYIYCPMSNEKFYYEAEGRKTLTLNICKFWK